MAYSQYFETEKIRDEFLATPRTAVLLTNRREGTPMGVPVWFDSSLLRSAAIRKAGPAQPAYFNYPYRTSSS